jgi:hypothetical protein
MPALEMSFKLEVEVPIKRYHKCLSFSNRKEIGVTYTKEKDGYLVTSKVFIPT